ncbi:lysophospholipid acyltransferase family protein [Parendozoicomonas haliclonae]|uniref:Acyltransferase n=1 Tax=Parendozoicomonas haliclonae TaxID=1960125 RepID=A0A1X7AQZ9_9GAMM|nr:lysophospholipid acyltransferase family protein [Parendozoicomonas haliclonae]SMA50573.1 Acyltransferase [Parendozoicomonas haliclonae]
MRLTVFNTPVLCLLLGWLARLMMKICGWKIEGQRPCCRSFVMVAGPHTSNWDFVVFMAVALTMRVPLHWLGKSSLFWGPFGPIMRYLGGIPVNRQQKNNLVDKAVAAFNCHQRFVLALSPEGTRSTVSKWKTGFWHIANQAKVPVIPGYADFSRKVAGIGPIYRLTGNKDKDIANLQAFFAPFRGCRQEEQSRLVTNTPADLP